MPLSPCASQDVPSGCSLLRTHAHRIYSSMNRTLCAFPCVSCTQTWMRIVCHTGHKRLPQQGHCLPWHEACRRFEHLVSWRFGADCMSVPKTHTHSVSDTQCVYSSANTVMRTCSVSLSRYHDDG